MLKMHLLTVETAAHFPSEISNGFSRPHLGWSTSEPEQLEDVNCGCMTSNVWIGEPTAMRVFIEELAKYYDELKRETDNDIDEWRKDHSVSLGYWEMSGVAMIAEFCMGDRFFEQKSDALWAKMLDMRILLCEGNDNDPGYILTNNVVALPLLDVATRLLLANFMTSSCLWVLDRENGGLKGFTKEDADTLWATLERHAV